VIRADISARVVIANPFPSRPQPGGQFLLARLTEHAAQLRDALSIRSHRSSFSRYDLKQWFDGQKIMSKSNDSSKRATQDTLTVRKLRDDELQEVSGGVGKRGAIIVFDYEGIALLGGTVGGFPSLINNERLTTR
jgi:hypothetical protein